MSDIPVPYIVLFLVSLFLLLIFVLFILIIYRHNLRGCFIPSLVIVGLSFILIYFRMEALRIYQCLVTVPDQITVAGHVKDNSNYLNGYLVLLYRDNIQIQNYVTVNGYFREDQQDRPNDGYFELTIPNADRLTRCSMIDDFTQASSGHNVLWFNGKTTYLWHNFTELRPGSHIPINRDQPKMQKYILVISPRNVDQYPSEIKLYPTFLDQNGDVAINMPVKTYSGAVGPSSAPFPIQDAWVTNNSTQDILGPAIPDDEMIDIDNCSESVPKNETYIRRIIYIHEVQFPDAYSNYDLRDVAIKAAPSLGFTQGQMEVEEASVNVFVPEKTHTKFKVFWQERWKTGMILADQGLSPVQLPFKARTGMQWYLVSYPVDCPQ